MRRWKLSVKLKTSYKGKISYISTAGGGRTWQWPAGPTRSSMATRPTMKRAVTLVSMTRQITLIEAKTVKDILKYLEQDEEKKVRKEIGRISDVVSGGICCTIVIYQF